MSRRYKIAFFRLVLLSAVGFLVRVTWIGSALFAPFSIDPDAHKRECHQPETQIILSRTLLSASQLAPPNEIRAEIGPFSFSPEVVTSGLKLWELEAAGCRWHLAVVPAETSRAEIRRLGVALRHLTTPIVVVSHAPTPILSLSNGVLARAGFLHFHSPLELFSYPRILTSYGVSQVSTSENSADRSVVLLKLG